MAGAEMLDGSPGGQPGGETEGYDGDGTPSTDGGGCFPPTDVLCACHHVPSYCCPQEKARQFHPEDPLRNFMLPRGGSPCSEGVPGAEEGGCFVERERALKERFLALEEPGPPSEDGDAQLQSFLALDDETEEERREREYRRRKQQLEEEDRLAELEALQAIYARASKRVFRRLKNLPEPPPGCCYTGCGEEEDDVDVPGNMYPGEGEETGPDYWGNPAAAVASGGEYPTSDQSHPSPGAVVSRLRRRRKNRRQTAAAVAPEPAGGCDGGWDDSSPVAAGRRPHYQDAHSSPSSPLCCATIAPAPPSSLDTAGAGGDGHAARRPFPEGAGGP
eukprot:Hpha_TRINITY_DN16889_c4_g3::TRINITY_DN16889_c4_g3_i1::g.148294::m.148294